MPDAGVSGTRPAAKAGGRPACGGRKSPKGATLRPLAGRRLVRPARTPAGSPDTAATATPAPPQAAQLKDRRRTQSCMVPRCRGKRTLGGSRGSTSTRGLCWRYGPAGRFGPRAPAGSGGIFELHLPALQHGLALKAQARLAPQGRLSTRGGSSGSGNAIGCCSCPPTAGSRAQGRPRPGCCAIRQTCHGRPAQLRWAAANSGLRNRSKLAYGLWRTISYLGFGSGNAVARMPCPADRLWVRVPERAGLLGSGSAGQCAQVPAAAPTQSRPYCCQLCAGHATRF